MSEDQVRKRNPGEVAGGGKVTESRVLMVVLAEVWGEGLVPRDARELEFPRDSSAAPPIHCPLTLLYFSSLPFINT